MEQAVIDGKVSFSRSGAVSKSVNWLSLIVPNDAELIRENLQNFKDYEYVPIALEAFNLEKNYFDSRYDSSIKWIEENNHAVISNGPFYLKSYSPESRTITINAFADDSYPFEAGYWQEFEKIKFPKIIQIDMPDVVTMGEEVTIPVYTKDASKIDYFFTNSEGRSVDSGSQLLESGKTNLVLTKEQTNEFGIGANDLKVFAVSDSVLRPDIYSVSFLVASQATELPDIVVSEEQLATEKNEYTSLVAIVLGAIIIGSILYIRHKRKKSLKIQT